MMDFPEKTGAMTNPRMPFPVVLFAVVLLGAITLLVNKMHGKNRGPCERSGMAEVVGSDLSGS
jgi:hypothetical protein